jgi:hypothetical protein
LVQVFVVVIVFVQTGVYFGGKVFVVVVNFGTVEVVDGVFFTETLTFQVGTVV